LPIADRAKRVWNAFINPQANAGTPIYYGGGYSDVSPSRSKLSYSSEKSIIASILTRLSVDVSGIGYRHIKTDADGRYIAEVDSTLNTCLTLEPNIDQGPRAFRQDIAMTLFDKGSAAIVPIDTGLDPKTKEIIDFYQLRVGTIVAWFPEQVKLSVYNEASGKREEIVLDKRFVAIIENPLYAVMNQPNSTLQRLISKLNLLDLSDEQATSGKLDIIIQLPYVIKSEARRAQAEQRRSDIELQLKESQYGIAYTDGTERITQLNRPAENKLLAQVEYLTKMLYSQLGLTEEVMNGTANEATMVNYYNRAIDPVVDAIVEAMQRSFIGPIGLAKHEEIKYFKDPFKLVPVSQLAELADKFTRNEILSSNEIRDAIGYTPSKDPKADELRNSNLAPPNPNSGSRFNSANPTDNNPSTSAQPATNGSSGG
jgi:hypothetical protein